MVYNFSKGDMVDAFSLTNNSKFLSELETLRDKSILDRIDRVGIELLPIEAKINEASVDSYLKYAQELEKQLAEQQIPSTEQVVDGSRAILNYIQAVANGDISEVVTNFMVTSDFVADTRFKKKKLMIRGAGGVIYDDAVSELPSLYSSYPSDIFLSQSRPSRFPPQYGGQAQSAAYGGQAQSAAYGGQAQSAAYGGQAKLNFSIKPRGNQPGIYKTMKNPKFFRKGQTTPVRFIEVKDLNSGTTKSVVMTTPNGVILDASKLVELVIQEVKPLVSPASFMLVQFQRDFTASEFDFGGRPLLRELKTKQFKAGEQVEAKKSTTFNLSTRLTTIRDNNQWDITNATYSIIGAGGVVENPPMPQIPMSQIPMPDFMDYFNNRPTPMPNIGNDLLQNF
jgi:hypothetical protein